MSTLPFPTDSEGYLQNIEDWSEELVTQLALAENLELTPLHWEIILFTRQFYLEHQDMPKMRALISHLRLRPEHAGVNSATIHHLFPLGPALQIAKIAGLPKPVRCL